MVSEPPSKASSGGLSCYAHGTSALRTLEVNEMGGDNKECWKTSLRTSMKAPKGTREKGEKQGQRTKVTSLSKKQVNSLVSMMEQFAALEMEEEDEDTASQPKIIKRGRSKHCIKLIFFMESSDKQ